MDYEKISRDEALRKGLKRYFTGSPCKHGHTAQRFVSTGNCCACNNERASSYKSKLQAARSGHFSYPCHPDDVAALLAYAQALDMARGRLPFVPQAAPAFAPPDVVSEQTRAQIAATRARAAPPLPTAGPSSLAPAMADQLRAAGLLP